MGDDGFLPVDNPKDAIGILSIVIAFVGNGALGARAALRSGEIAGSDSLLFFFAAGGSLLALLITIYERTELSLRG